MTRAKIDRRRLVLTGASTMAVAFATPVWAQDQAFRQRAVDDLVARIGTAVETSLDTSDWRRNYDQARRNIEDLKKALQYGGKVTSNPVAEFKSRLDALWEERRAWLTYLQGTIIRLQRLSAHASQQAVNDIGAAMIRFLTTPVPGAGTLLNTARTRDAEVIRREFARVRSQQEAIKVTREYIEQLLENMNDLKERRAALEPLSAAYAALLGGIGEGDFRGSVVWKQSGRTGEAQGPITLKIADGRVSGTITVPGKSETRTAQITGRVSGDGTIVAEIRGRSEWKGDPADKIIAAIMSAVSTFPFAGSLGGRVNGNSASGSFEARSTDSRAKPTTISGTWKASHQ